MSKFHVIGYNQSEVALGIAPLLNKELNQAIQTPGFVQQEVGKVLQYTYSPYNDEAMNVKFGKFYSYYFIKDSFMPFMNESMKQKVIAEIDESELPEGKELGIKL